MIFTSCRVVAASVEGFRLNNDMMVIMTNSPIKQPTQTGNSREASNVPILVLALLINRRSSGLEKALHICALQGHRTQCQGSSPVRVPAQAVSSPDLRYSLAIGNPRAENFDGTADTGRLDGGQEDRRYPDPVRRQDEHFGASQRDAVVACVRATSSAIPLHLAPIFAG